MIQPRSILQKSLNLWAIILIIWSLYRTNLHLPEWFDEFLAKPSIFILPVFYFITRIEKNDFFNSIWFSQKKISKDVLYGVIIGFFFLTSSLFSNYIRNSSLFSEGISIMTLIYFTALAASTSISEEILSRGFILNRLYQDSNSVFKSSFQATLLFIVLHVPILFTNLKLSGNTLLIYLLTLTILSLTNSFIFLQRKSITVPIFIHFFYNLAISLYF